MIIYPRRFGREKLNIHIRCSRLDWQVASMTQHFDALVAVFSAVENLTLEFERDIISSVWHKPHNEAGRILWHYLLKPFGNVKTPHVAKGLVTELSRTLQPEDCGTTVGVVTRV